MRHYQPCNEESPVTAPKLALSDTAVTETTADVVVVGTVQEGQGFALAPGGEAVDEAFGGTLVDVLTTLGATGKAEEIVKVPTLGRLSAGLVVAVGLGKDATPERVRRAAGAAARTLTGVKRAYSYLSDVDLHAAIEGTVLGAYTFTKYKSAENGDGPVARVDFHAEAT